MLNRAIFGHAPDKISDTTVTATIVDSRAAYRQV